MYTVLNIIICFVNTYHNTMSVTITYRTCLTWKKYYALQRIHQDLLPSIFTVPPPEITTHPQDTVTNQGDRALLTCAASATYGPVTYQWQRVDGVPLDTDKTFGITRNRLTISNTLPGDSGLYVCVVSNQDGSTTSREAFLRVNGIYVH